MSLQFHGSERASLGVEIELQIIDPVTWDLTPRAQEVLALCEERGLVHVKAEVHQSMLEVDTRVSADVKECRECLQATLSGLIAVVEELGLCISVSGTHPFQQWAERQIYPSARYLGLQDKYRWLAKRMNIYGLHVHVGVSDTKKAIGISYALTQFLPHLLALSANSPFWHGEHTGMQTCRPNIIETFPSGGLQPYLESWEDLELYYNTLADAKVITSPKDLYWYIRPNMAFGTIEFRICDAMSSIDETLAIVALIQNLVTWMDEDETRWSWDIKQHWIAPENLLIAARDGLEGMIITDLAGSKKQIKQEVYSLIEQLTPIANSLNNQEEFFYLKTMLEQGTGAMRQKDVYENTGSLPKVVEQCSKDFISSVFGSTVCSMS
jgi:glutamate---cysteine ligase / carboxylate-amine ligase